MHKPLLIACAFSTLFPNFFHTFTVFTLYHFFHTFSTLFPHFFHTFSTLFLHTIQPQALSPRNVTAPRACVRMLAAVPHVWCRACCRARVVQLRMFVVSLAACSRMRQCVAAAQVCRMFAACVPRVCCIWFLLHPSLL